GERRFRVAEELALDGFGILEAVRDRQRAIVDFRWTYANPAMLKLLRVAGAELAGRRLLEHLPGQRSHPAFFPAYVQVVESGAPSSAEAFYDADGLRGWFRIDAVRLDDGVALPLRDVTERKEREAARQESEDRFRLLADAVDDVFWITDVRQQKVVYVSPAYERVWGFSAERLYRDPKAWREHIDPQDRALVDQVFDQMLAGRRETFELVYRIQGPNGAPRWVRDKAWLVRSADGERAAGVMTDISAEKESTEKQRLLSRELDHRLKNTFSLVQSIVRLSARGARDLGAFVDNLEARVRALARGQDLLVRGSWLSADLEELVREILALHGGPESRIQIEGPPVQVAASAVPLFNMAFHELATNATKYGALSVPGGKVSVSWRIQADESGPALCLTWRERGGPVVRPPPARGFGSMLIEQALASDFGGEIELAFPPEGIACTMRLPLSERLTSSHDAAA
ncbi:MAG TPA: HWE histidine kinase domain-containing protein, partial [Geminicoccaceae bacterium]|nr:HWE histidine kinase domain-containing protein [Geminicoccaceae bacterium]